MRRRSEVSGTGVQAEAPAAKARGQFLECACGLRQSASVVLKTGKCVRCSAPMSAPEGTEETYTGNLAADHVAKNGHGVPPGERAATRVAAEPEGEDWVTSDAGRKAPGNPSPDIGNEPDEFGPDPFGPAGALPERPGPAVREFPSISPPGPKNTAASSGLGPAGSSFVRVFSPGAPLSGEEVLVTWPEEIIKLAEFCTVRVGPFSVGAKLREGEDRMALMRGLYGDLVAMAEAERDRKIESFRRVLQREVPANRAR